MRLVAITAAIALSASAWAQEAGELAAATQPTTAPSAISFPDPEDERFVERLLRAAPGTAKPVQPVTPEEARETSRVRKQTVRRSPNVPLKRDGDAITNRIGYLQPTPDGAYWQYEFESARQGRIDPPMIIAPSSQLAAMIEKQNSAGREVRFRVSGIITQYAGQNYLVIDTVREWPSVGPTTAPSDDELLPEEDLDGVAEEEPGHLDPGQEEVADQPTTAQTDAVLMPTTGPVDPEAALEQLLRPRPRMAPPLTVPESEISATAQPTGIVPDMPAQPLRREGEMLVQRVGRLHRNEEGQWPLFAFDADNRGLTEPPVVLIPNKRLEQMETALERAGLDLRFSVTGRITTFQGRNYLLVEKAQVVTDHEGL